MVKKILDVPWNPLVEELRSDLLVYNDRSYPFLMMGNDLILTTLTLLYKNSCLSAA